MNKDVKTVVRAALAGAVALGALTALPAQAGDKPQMEKCYGVAAAHHNDCQTASNSCAGSAEKDRQPDAFIAVPKGLCEKIAGGTLTAPAKPAGKG